MDYQRACRNSARPQDVIQEGLIVGGTELDGIAGVLWDVQGIQAIAPRDSDVIYRLYRQETPSTEGDTLRPLRGRCFVSEPQRSYVIGETVMLETRDGQRIFGTIQHIREMRTGSVSLILNIKT